LRRDSNRQKLSKILFSRTISQCASMNASERAFSAAEDKEFVSVDEQTTRKSLRPDNNRKGFTRGEPSFGFWVIFTLLSSQYIHH